MMKKILLIEDDAPLSWLLGKILKSRYDLTIIRSSMDAWSWLSERNVPDLIIYDLNTPTPERVEFLENIRLSGFFSDIPVIMLSGSPDDEQRQQCLELGAFSYVAKPFEPQALLSAIKNGLLQKNEVVLID
jgi:two-component system chemotaxis response regulator CheY